ncbi:MAG: sulfur carrier protein ThiS [Planctomycetes bacterium]|nr:sulfur carrier protein ThiS [Planctomycetota bacterium]
MKIVVNGKEQDFAGSTVEELVAGLKLDRSRVATELNKEIVRRADYPSTTLKEGDRIEIVTFVGGG